MDAAIATIFFLATLFLISQIRRDILKKLPWSSLMVLMLPHGFFGWLLGVYNMPWFVWLLAGMGAGLVAAVMSYELGVIGARALVLAGVIAGIGGVAGIAIGVTVEKVAEALALALMLAVAWFWSVAGTRFRLERLGFDTIQIFWMITLTSWEGIWLGWVLDTFILPSFGIWLIEFLTS
jgi:hypothetical protein